MATMTAPIPSSTRHRTMHAIDTVRWAPAPRWEGSASSKSRYAAYLAGSVLAWIGIGIGLSAALGGLVGLGG